MSEPPGDWGIGDGGAGELSEVDAAHGVAIVEPRLRPLGPAAALMFPRVVDVTLAPFGAKGDGSTDDTEAVQAALTRAPDGGVVYFPRGSYVVENLRISGRQCLTLLGDGHRSRIVRRRGRPIRVNGVDSDDGATEILLVEDSSDITIERLGFETNGANGIDRPGGVRFLACAGVRVRDCRFRDSHRRDFGADDRIALRFEGDAAGRNSDVSIEDNLFENLSVKVAMTSRARIAGNHFIYPVPVGIWIGGMGHDSVQEDIDIDDNEIVHPFETGIRVSNVDWGGGAPTRNAMRRIRIAGNRIRKGRNDYVAIGGEGIFVGNSSERGTEANAFESVLIDDNTILLSREVGNPTRGIWLQLEPRREPSAVEPPNWDHFALCAIRDNMISGSRGFENLDTLEVFGAGIEAAMLYRCEVANNMIRDSDCGVKLAGGLMNNLVHHNASDGPQSAFFYKGSLGGNVIFTDVFMDHAAGAQADLQGNGDRVPDFHGDSISWADR